MGGIIRSKQGIGSSGYYKGRGFSASLSSKVHSVLRKSHNFGTAKKLHGIVDTAMNVAFTGGSGLAKGRATAPEFEAVINVMKSTQQNKFGVKFTDHDIEGVQNLFAKHLAKKGEYGGSAPLFSKKEGMSKEQYEHRTLTEQSTQGQVRGAFGDRNTRSRKAVSGLVDSMVGVAQAAGSGHSYRRLDRQEAQAITNELSERNIITDREKQRLDSVFDRRLGKSPNAKRAGTLRTDSPIRESVVARRAKETDIGKSRIGKREQTASPAASAAPAPGVHIAAPAAAPTPAPAPSQSSSVQRPLP